MKVKSRRAILGLLIGLLPAWLAPMALAKPPARLGVVQFPNDLARELGLDAEGALVFLIIPRSAAGVAGLKPGDLIVQADDHAVRSFSDLNGVIRKKSAGDKLRLEYVREGGRKSAEITLSGWIGELSTESHAAAVAFLRGLGLDDRGPIFYRELVNSLWSAGDRRGAVETVGKAIERFDGDGGFLRRRLELLLLSGDYEGYVREATELSDKHPQSRPLAVQKAEALLAVGKLAEAEELAAKIAADSQKNPFVFDDNVMAADRIWAISRIRQGKSLADADEARNRRRLTHPDLAVFAYWLDMLKDRVPYRITSSAASTELPFHAEGVLFGLAPYKMHGITVLVNGVEVPLAIVDTGASHTLISTQTAKQANVATGTAAREAAGSLSFTARPGVIDELKIGNLVLRDVPVNVGNPPPLVMTKAKMAIGVDIMHHLRFSLDYKNQKVKVEPARTSIVEAEETNEATWDIPLWTFADHVMSQAYLPNGNVARTLIDSGNFAQTLVWPTWAKQNLSNHPGETGSLFLYAMTNPQRSIKGLTLGGRPLPDWPVMDMPPVTLQGVDLLDLLMGHDLLSQYDVTIDMLNRRLRLRSPGSTHQPPVAKKPLAL